MDQEGADDTYLHNHVERACNSVWGDPISWKGDDYVYSCDFDLDSQWRKDSLQVVAFIYNYDENDPNNCVVANAEAIDFKDLQTNAVRTVDIADEDVDYYTLSGLKIPVKTGAKGFLIEKKGGQRRKVFLK